MASCKRCVGTGRGLNGAAGISVCTSKTVCCGCVPASAAAVDHGVNETAVTGAGWLLAQRERADIPHLESLSEWAEGLAMDTDCPLKATGMPQPDCKMSFTARKLRFG